MTKIALTTKYSAYNFGAMLQTYALQNSLQKLGADCFVVDADRKRTPGSPRGYGLSSVLGKIFYRLYQNDLQCGYDRFESFLNDFNKSKHYSSYDELKQKPPVADVYLTGSDQVFNPLDIQENYFLRYAPQNAVRASYAASMGISYIPDGCKNIFREYLKDFDYVSVREKTAQELIKEEFGQEVTVNVDPTLLLTEAQWEKVAVENNFDKPYIFCYVLYKPAWLNGWLKQLHKKTGKEIVVISSDAYRNIYHTKMVRNAGPREMLGWLRNADFVISSSFHGVALSIANRKPFYAVVNPDAPARISDLLGIFGLENRIIDAEHDFILTNIDYEPVAKRQLQEQRRSFEYLKMLVEHPEKHVEIRPKKQAVNGTISLIGDKCTGCKACGDICPVEAIAYYETDEGFQYPFIDDKKCISCGKCLKTCHVVDERENTKENCTAYYGWIKDSELRNQSSSGGVFSALADYIIRQGGLVVGAYFDAEQKRVLHGSSDTIEIAKFRRSKYVESELANVFPSVKSALAQGRKVLFTGTPCQCAGIRKRFGEDENLILCDFFCHGVPSSKVFKEFLEEKEKRKKEKLIDYQFRTKEFGWSHYGVATQYESGKIERTVGRCEFYFTSTMMDNLFLRKACYTCDKSMYHYADITIGDFWGIHALEAAVNDNRGISAVVVNTPLGKEYLDAVAAKMELYPLQTHYLDYAFKVKVSDKTILKRNRLFEEYNRIGLRAFAKKHYWKRLWLSKLVFALRKRKFMVESKT